MHTTDYINHKGLNQSFLKCHDNYNTLYNYLTKEKVDKYTKGGFLLGSLVDTLLTNEDEFDNLFFVGEEGKVTKSEKIYVDAFREKHSNKSIIDFKDIELVRQLGLWSNMLESTIEEKKLNTDSMISYYFFLIEKESKFLITQEELDTAKYIKNLFLTTETKPFFDNITQYQVEVYEEIYDVLAKGLLDAIIKTDKELKIYDILLPAKSILPIDLKITTIDVKTACWKYKYQIQALWYYKLLQKAYPDYTILNPVYLFASPTWNYTLWYQFSDFDLLFAQKGGSFINGKLEIVDNPKYWGVEQYLEAYKKYQIHGYDKPLNKDGKISDIYQ